MKSFKRVNDAFKAQTTLNFKSIKQQLLAEPQTAGSSFI